MARSAPTSQQEVRQRNLSRVLHAVAQQRGLSRAAVAVRIGLTRTAVSTLVEELLAAGLLVELGPARPSGIGRPGSALALADRGPCGLGAEIGVGHLAVCAVDLRGRVRARAERDWDRGAPQGGSPGSVLTLLGELTARVCAELRPLGLLPAGLALAVPGLVARGTSTVVNAPGLGWRGIDLAAPLVAPFPCTVGNEANFAALAERWLGSGRDGGTGPDGGAGAREAGMGAPEDFLHVSAEAGIGAAVVLGGELVCGNAGFAGELGHAPVYPEGRMCHCGARGCLEQYAGKAAVLEAAGIAPGSGGVGLLEERALAGDPSALDALEQAGRVLGIALAGAVSLLDPEAVVLGGALARFHRWLLPACERELRQRTASGAVPDLCASALGREGALLGAAHSVVRSVLNDPMAHGRSSGSCSAR